MSQNRRQTKTSQQMHDQAAPSLLLDIDLEGELIGAVLDDNIALKDCAFLSPEHFADPVHAEIWDRILWLRQKGNDATLSTLALDLGETRLHSIGGRPYLADLASRGLRIRRAVPEAAERIKNLALWRRLRALSTDMLSWSEAATGNADDVISTAINELKLALNSGGSRARRKSEVARDAVKFVLKGADAVPTGIWPLDYLLHGGLMPSRSIAILGLYGRGKTILKGSISDNINRLGVNHLVIDLETPPEDTEIRNTARHLNLNAAQLYDKDDPKWKDFTRSAEKFANKVKDHTWYEYAPGASIDEIERMIIRAIHLFGIKGVFIDYWQLIQGREKGQNTHEHLKIVADRLANIARRENIWLVVMAQCDENGEARDCKTGLHTAMNMVLRLVRGENDDTAYFDTLKSNHTRYASTSDEASNSMIFSLAGPHFRAADDEDSSRFSAGR